jgi:K319-like protein/ZU5 domain-containing protein
MRFGMTGASDRPLLTTGTAMMLGLVVIAAMGCGDTPTTLDNPDPPQPPANVAPIAAAGADLGVSTGLTVSLDGSASTDPDNDALTYAWTLTAPPGSAASLDDATSATPAFVPDIDGDYVVALTVNDGALDSPADDATITAVNNTATVAVVAAVGGTVASTDGGVSLVIPPGAMALDADISITLVGEGQVPAALTALSGDVIVYDLQPSGLQFSVPTAISFEVENAVAEAQGSVQINIPLFMSESEGTLEALEAVSFVQDTIDPTKATITGGLTHFSSAAVVEAAGLVFRAEVPQTAEVGVAFDVLLTVDITDADIGDIVSATIDDVSLAPVNGSGWNSVDLDVAGTVATSTQRYRCDDVGAGRFRANLRFDATDTFGSFAQVQLGKAVTCVEPGPTISTRFISLFRAQRLLRVPESVTSITSGGGVRLVDLETATATLDMQGVFAPGDLPEFVSALSDGTYLVHTALGQVAHVDPAADTVIVDPEVDRFDQVRHAVSVTGNVMALASGWGDFGLLKYDGNGFTDAFRDLSVLGGPQQMGTNLQAVWVSADESTVIGAVTAGNGDSAFDETDTGLLITNPTTGSVTVVPMPGIIEFVIDFDVRHLFDLDCEDLGAEQYLCVFTSGFEGPAFNGPGEDKAGDGYVVVFMVDSGQTAQTAELIYWDYGNARVGAAVFADALGQGFWAAAANQFTGAVDMWRIDAGTVAESGSYPVSDQCPNPIDLVDMADGAYVALACQTPSNSPSSGILVIDFLNYGVPPAS